MGETNYGRNKVVVEKLSGVFLGYSLRPEVLSPPIFRIQEGWSEHYGNLYKYLIKGLKNRQ